LVELLVCVRVCALLGVRVGGNVQTL
jgi:hypothetical protein